jgi:hypothetical protein
MWSWVWGCREISACFGTAKQPRQTRPCVCSGPRGSAQHHSVHTDTSMTPSMPRREPPPTPPRHVTGRHSPRVCSCSIYSVKYEELISAHTGCTKPQCPFVHSKPRSSAPPQPHAIPVQSKPVQVRIVCLRFALLSLTHSSAASSPSPASAASNYSHATASTLRHRTFLRAPS